jgi:hypothetical protein
MRSYKTMAAAIPKVAWVEERKNQEGGGVHCILPWDVVGDSRTGGAGRALNTQRKWCQRTYGHRTEMS